MRYVPKLCCVACGTETKIMPHITVEIIGFEYDIITVSVPCHTNTTVKTYHTSVNPDNTTLRTYYTIVSTVSSH